MNYKQRTLNEWKNSVIFLWGKNVVFTDCNDDEIVSALWKNVNLHIMPLLGNYFIKESLGKAAGFNWIHGE
jgi:hypothetical protein